MSLICLSSVDDSCMHESYHTHINESCHTHVNESCHAHVNESSHSWFLFFHLWLIGVWQRVFDIWSLIYGSSTDDSCRSLIYVWFASCLRYMEASSETIYLSWNMSRTLSWYMDSHELCLDLWIRCLSADIKDLEQFIHRSKTHTNHHAYMKEDITNHHRYIKNDSLYVFDIWMSHHPYIKDIQRIYIQGGEDS